MGKFDVYKEDYESGTPVPFEMFVIAMIQSDISQMMIAINVDVLVIGIPEVGSTYAVDENNERKIKMDYLEGMNDGESAGILENDRKGESNEILEKRPFFQKAFL